MSCIARKNVKSLIVWWASSQVGRKTWMRLGQPVHYQLFLIHLVIRVFSTNKKDKVSPPIVPARNYRKCQATFRKLKICLSASNRTSLIRQRHDPSTSPIRRKESHLLFSKINIQTCMIQLQIKLPLRRSEEVSFQKCQLLTRPEKYLPEK